MTLKCKMCGGELNITLDSTICECEYCGSKQTIPNTDDEKRLKLYERANKLRFECEFDKASGVYESIVSEFQDEAEAYWGLVLCKYGIEYVDDPKTGKKIPTCHRSSFDSVFDDDNFDRVMESADTVARGVYREEAKQIEELRKGIIEVSSKEEAYDIFICYKETADDGQRTIDSVIAQDVYDALVEKDYRVFFSRITLEDKLGVEYEPYIFAALNSAKVMLAFGTSYDYYNAVWVKNEWSRFLQLMESGQKKTLIPCYKDIDAYDMPKEFAKLQAQDMGKVGAIQDLLRGIDKIFGKDKKTERILDMSGVLANDGNATSKRGYFSLEDGDWEKAIEYFDQALYKDAENASAHLGLFLAKRKCSNLDDFLNNYIQKLDEVPVEELTACEPDKERINLIAKENHIANYYEISDITPQFAFDLKFVSKLKGLEGEKTVFNDSDWKKAERFAKGEIEDKINSTKNRFFNELNKRIDEEKEHNNFEQTRIRQEYEAFINTKEDEIKSQRFEAEAKREKDYISYCEKYENLKSEAEFTSLIGDLRKLCGYKDSEKIIEGCKEKIKDLKRIENEKLEKEQTLKRKKIKKVIIAISIAFVITIIGIIGYSIYKKKVIIPKQKYEEASSLMEEAKYDEAIVIFEELGDYDDSKNKIDECNTKLAEAKEAAEKEAEEKKRQEENKKLDEIKEMVDGGDVEGAINLCSDLKSDIKSEAIDYIVEKVKSQIEELSPTKDLNLSNVHNSIEILDGLVEENVMNDLKSEFNGKCYFIILKKNILYRGGGNRYLGGPTENYAEISLQNYLNYMFDDGGYKDEKDILYHLIDFCRSLVEEKNNNLSSGEGYEIYIISDDTSHTIKVKYSSIKNMDEEYYLISIQNDKLIIGETPDKGTISIAKDGTFERLGTPVEENAMTFEY